MLNLGCKLALQWQIERQGRLASIPLSWDLAATQTAFAFPHGNAGMLVGEMGKMQDTNAG